MRARTCRECRERFIPERQMQPVCDKEECRNAFAHKAYNKARQKRQAAEKKAKAAERRADKARLLELKPAKYWWRRARKVFNRWVRLRDAYKLCISCDRRLVPTGNKPGGDYDAGHYRSVGSAKHLEFDERNVHGQCKHCNDALKGNPIGYERGLLFRIGKEAVEALKADQNPRHLTAADYQAIEARYAARIKEMTK